MKQSVQIKDSVKHVADTANKETQEINFADSFIRSPVPSINFEENADLTDEIEKAGTPTFTPHRTDFPAESPASTIDEIEMAKDSAISADTTPKDLSSQHEKEQTIVQTQTTNNDNFNEKQPDNENLNWTTGIILLILFLLAWLRFKHKTYLRHIVNAFMSNRFVQQMLREVQSLTKQASIIFSTIFFLSASLFITRLLCSARVINKLNEYGNLNFSPDDNLIFFLKVLAVLVFFCAVKLLLLRISGYVFKIQGVITEYIFNMFLFYKITGLLLFLLVVFIAFFSILPDETFIKIGLLLVAVLFSFRLSKMLVLGNTTTNYSIFYIILYLCTLEILPLIAVFKVLVSMN